MIDRIPSHMEALVNEVGEYTMLPRWLNCFCIAALFHSPELLSQMSSDYIHNSVHAINFLFREGRFVEGRGPGREYGTVNILCTERRKYDWFTIPENVIHVSVNLGGMRVLTKHGTGISKCEIMSYNDDMRAYTRGGGPHSEPFMVSTQDNIVPIYR